ncbi:centrosomal protein CCDC61 isoform X2 [Pseudophryne corroboree]|uniref:centrosomal protein CCDC61 isoform X2 n=1 Tax=Pseudophryne corroboree TaxID=495146 RepID=UPI003081FD1C
MLELVVLQRWAAVGELYLYLCCLPTYKASRHGIDHIMDDAGMAEARCVFRGIEHILRVRDAGDRLEVEVEDALTTDQWRGEFDAEFIEDLTHKTGNFKQFSIFCNMLHSALIQTSESVTLDLLTYADLELLRHRKAGGAQRQAPAARSSTLSSKRYLILIYSVEFDRIHYPLPLPYVGKPDPVYLRQVIRGLKDELAALKLVSNDENREPEIRQLQEELQRMTEEKREADLALQRRQDLEIPNGKETSHIRVLKRAVQTLEMELQKERSRSQRLASKRREECQQLTEQLEEARAVERTLCLKVKSLTTELAMYKRGRVTPTGPSSQSRSSSAGRGPIHRSTSRGETGTRRERSTSRERSGRSSGEGRSLARQPRLSPSPMAIRPPRFDPTAYIRDKERKKKDADLKKGRQALASPSSMRGQRRSSSVESLRSHRSYQSSGDEMEYAEPLPSSGDRKLATRGRKPFAHSSWNSRNRGNRDRSAGKKRLSSTPNYDRKSEKENRFDPASDLSDIDARLQALQDYMRNLDTRT